MARVSIGLREDLDPAALESRLRSVRPDVGRVVVLARVGSTSSLLASEAVQAGDAGSESEAAWPDRSVLVADHQDAGRGRRGRSWQTPPGAALPFSVLLRPPGPSAGWGWLPLLAGLATVRGLADVGGPPAGLKWPNDVLTASGGVVGKLAGVLSEVVTTPSGPGVVVGIGVNVDQEREELPLPTAQSCRTAGFPVARADLLVAVVARLLELEDRRRAGDPALPVEVGGACRTLGTDVRVDLPGGAALHGRAVALAPDGGLVVRTAEGERTVLAGDVHHIRPAAEG